jgi:hypothetical protein
VADDLAMENAPSIAAPARAGQRSYADATKPPQRPEFHKDDPAFLAILTESSIKAEAIISVITPLTSLHLLSGVRPMATCSQGDKFVTLWRVGPSGDLPQATADVIKIAARLSKELPDKWIHVAQWASDYAQTVISYPHRPPDGGPEALVDLIVKAVAHAYPGVSVVSVAPVYHNDANRTFAMEYTVMVRTSAVPPERRIQFSNQWATYIKWRPFADSAPVGSQFHNGWLFMKTMNDQRRRDGDRKKNTPAATGALDPSAPPAATARPPPPAASAPRPASAAPSSATASPKAPALSTPTLRRKEPAPRPAQLSTVSDSTSASPLTSDNSEAPVPGAQTAAASAPPPANADLAFKVVDYRGPSRPGSKAKDPSSRPSADKSRRPPPSALSALRPGQPAPPSTHAVAAAEVLLVGTATPSAPAPAPAAQSKRKAKQGGDESAAPIAANPFALLLARARPPPPPAETEVNFFARSPAKKPSADPRPGADHSVDMADAGPLDSEAAAAAPSPSTPPAPSVPPPPHLAPGSEGAADP